MYYRFNEIIARQEHENLLHQSRQLLQRSAAGRIGRRTGPASHLRAFVMSAARTRGHREPTPGITGPAALPVLWVSSSEEQQIRTLFQIDGTVDLSEGLRAAAARLSSLEMSARELASEAVSSTVAAASNGRRKNQESQVSTERPGRRALPDQHGNGSRHRRAHHKSGSTARAKSRR